MKILVTGGAGFVGTNLIKRLLSDGNNVISLDNYSTGFKSNQIDGCDYIEVDISDDSRRHKAFDLETFQLDEIDVIFHLAALARIQPSFKNPHEVFKVNTLGTENVLNWARKKNIPVVYAGSSSTHGDHYANPYTFTKWQGELLCEMYNKVYNLPTAVTRFYNVYGPHQILDGAYAAVIGIFQTQYKNNKPLTITGDGEQRRDFTHIEDIIDGLVKVGEGLLDNNIFTMVEGHIFELGRGKNYSINEIASFFKTDTMYVPKRPGEMDVTLCKSKNARNILGWNPKINIEDYVKNWISNEN